MNLLLSGGRVLTALERPTIREADVLVTGREIAAIGPEAGAAAAATSATRVDCSGCLLVPGSVCAHTHAYSALARGMPYDLDPPRSFLEILQRIWWRLDRALDEASVRASALVAGREALLAGTTTLIDHHASPNAIDGSLDVIAQALGELGIRSVLAYEVTDRDGRQRARAGIAENRRFLARVERGDLPLARGLVGAHASFTIGPDTLGELADLARMARTGIHVHVAEDAVDEADADARYGTRVVDRLATAGLLDDRTLLAHGVHLAPEEAARVAGSGATLAINTRSNLNNGVGRPPLDWLPGLVALGTDGIGGDLFEEGRIAYLGHREEHPEHPAGWPMAALARGARFAGGLFDEPRLGRLEPGAPADVAIVAYDPPTPLEADTIAAHWTWGIGARDVRDVIVAGELVVRDRRLTRVDERELVARARVQAGRLWERMGAIGPHPFAPAHLLATPIGGR